MIRDPLYRQILERLTEPLDPDAFERAVPELLPGSLGLAIPVTGGQDAGFDGAIVDGEGEPYPVVCTTGADVIGNLRSSLNSNLEAGFPRRQAVVATSQELSNRRRQNLYQAARELGFQLMGIFDRAPLAQLLYHEPRVRRQLLDLGGEPSALAAVPAPGQYQLQPKLLAREEDLQWLRTTSGDRILVGVPGAGKTALASILVEDGIALFVRPAAGIEAILDACREQGPSVLIVDDAHAYLDFLQELRTARHDSLVEFQILATTWPGQLAEVADALGVDPRQLSRQLELLTRSEILELYQSIGVHATDDVLRELVDQASNRPGLAVTLAMLWKQGAWNEIVRGAALSEFASKVVRRLAEGKIEVLAALALGGKAGVSQEGLSEALGVPVVDIRKVMTTLAPAGVISERGPNAFVVEPEQLRSALLAEVYFSEKPDRLPYQAVLAKVENQSSAAVAILHCLLRGGKLADSETRTLLAHARAKAWIFYAYLGQEQAAWVLNNYPGEIQHVARMLLERVPDETLARLLGQAHPVPENLGSAVSHPLRIIRDWVRDYDPTQRVSTTDSQNHKRDALCTAVSRYAEGGAEADVIGQAIAVALDPSLETQASAPDSRLTTRLSFSFVPAAVLNQLADLWRQQLLPRFSLSRPSLGPIREVLWKLVHPVVPAGGEVSEEQRQAAHALARTIIDDLGPLAREHPGVMRTLADLAASIGHELEYENDQVYDLLFPLDPVPRGDHEGWSRRQREAMNEIAEQWRNRPPEEVAAIIQKASVEAALVDHNWPDNRGILAYELARSVPALEVWLDAMVGAGLGGVVCEPFLDRSVKSRSSGWERHLEAAFERDDLVMAALRLGLTVLELPASIRQVAIERAQYSPQSIETLALRGELPVENLGLLLREGSADVKLAAAVGHWMADPKGEVSAELAQVWREIIVGTRFKGEDGVRAAQHSSYWLGEILASDPELAYAWLGAELENASPAGFFLLMENEPPSRAIEALGTEQRRELLFNANFPEYARSLVQRLVGSDPGLFEVLLARSELRPLHRAPLARTPDPSWWGLAAVASRAGITAEAIARASFDSEFEGWAGSEAEHYRKWLAVFTSPPHEASPEIEEVARMGRQIASEKVEAAARNERQEAMRDEV
jgi:hypothetical protein